MSKNANEEMERMSKFMGELGPLCQKYEIPAGTLVYGITKGPNKGRISMLHFSQPHLQDLWKRIEGVLTIALQEFTGMQGLESSNAVETFYCAKCHKQIGDNDQKVIKSVMTMDKLEKHTYCIPCAQDGL